MRFICIAAALLAATPLLPAQAQDYPAREVHVICGYTAGSGADILVRFFSDQLAKRAGKPFIVENKAGALTTIAGEYVRNAKPDGYTLYITAGNSSFASAPFLVRDLRYNPATDFSPITTLGRLPFVLTVSPKSPANSVAELTNILKDKNGKGFYGTSNAFAIAASERYAKTAGFKVDQVRYKSSGDAMMDMNNQGQLDFVFIDGTFAAQQKDKLRMLAVTTGVRSQVMPEVPTMIDAGVAEFDLTAWWGAWFPPKTPQPIVDKVSGWLNQILATDEAKKFLAQSATDPWPGSPRDLAALVPKEVEKWGVLIKDANIEPE